MIRRVSTMTLKFHASGKYGSFTPSRARTSHLQSSYQWFLHGNAAEGIGLAVHETLTGWRWVPEALASNDAYRLWVLTPVKGCLSLTEVI